VSGLSRTAKCLAAFSRPVRMRRRIQRIAASSALVPQSPVIACLATVSEETTDLRRHFHLNSKSLL